MQKMRTLGQRSKLYQRAYRLHQLSMDAHAVFVSYAYVHVVLFALFYAHALSLGALVLSDSVLLVAVFLSLVTRLVSLVYTERLLNRDDED